MVLGGALVLFCWASAPGAWAAPGDDGGATRPPASSAPGIVVAGAPTALDPIAALPTVAAIDRTSLASVRDAFRTWYLGDVVEDVGWSGSVIGCSPGAPTARAQAATLSRINYFRTMAGLGPVAFDRTLSTQAQQAALMMHANDRLDHHPVPGWKCWTADGALAASRSNLALGASGPAAIDLYMDDPFAGNEAAGHRRWILYPIQRVMGSGSTSIANALSVFAFDNSWPRPEPDLPVAWPSAGYFPQELEPWGRWSLSIADADFSGAAVSVTGPTGATLPVTVHRPQWGYGDHTLVWQVPLPASGWEPMPNGTYRVTVSGIAGVDTATHSYSVNLFRASPPAPAHGWLEALRVSGRRITVTGVASDPDGDPRVRVTSVVAGRRSVRTATAKSGRFLVEWDDVKGSHQVCVTLIDVPTNAETLLECRTAVVK